MAFFTGTAHRSAPVHYHLDAEDESTPPLADCYGVPDVDLTDTEEQPDYLLLDMLQHLPEDKAAQLLNCLSSREKALEEGLRRNCELADSCEWLCQQESPPPPASQLAGAEQRCPTVEPAPEPSCPGSASISACAGPAQLERALQALQKLQIDSQALVAQVAQLTRCMGGPAAGCNGADACANQQRAYATEGAPPEELVGPSGISVGTILQKIGALEAQLPRAIHDDNIQRGADGVRKVSNCSREECSSRAGQLIQKFDGMRHQKASQQQDYSTQNGEACDVLQESGPEAQRISPTKSAAAPPPLSPSPAGPAEGAWTPRMPPGLAQKSADSAQTLVPAAGWTAVAQLLEATEQHDEAARELGQQPPAPERIPLARAHVLAAPPPHSVPLASSGAAFVPVMPVFVQGVLPSAPGIRSTGAWVRSLSPVALCSMNGFGVPAVTTTHVYHHHVVGCDASQRAGSLP